MIVAVFHPKPSYQYASIFIAHRVHTPLPLVSKRTKTKNRLGRVTKTQAHTELERRDTSDSGVISEQALGKSLKRLGADIVGSDSGRLMHRFDIHEVLIASSRAAALLLPQSCVSLRQRQLSLPGEEYRGKATDQPSNPVRTVVATGRHLYHNPPRSAVQMSPSCRSVCRRRCVFLVLYRRTVQPTLKE